MTTTVTTGLTTKPGFELAARVRNDIVLPGSNGPTVIGFAVIGVTCVSHFCSSPCWESAGVSRAASAPGLLIGRVRGLTPDGTHVVIRLMSGTALAAGSCLRNRLQETPVASAIPLTSEESGG